MLYPVLIKTEYATNDSDPFWLDLIVEGRHVASVRSWGAFDNVAQEVAARLRDERRGDL